MPLEKTPGLISLLAGKPNSSTFPFTAFSFTARSSWTQQQPGSSDSDGAAAAEERTLELTGPELAQALQYGDTAGLKPLLDWIAELQRLSHGRMLGEGWKVTIGSGSQDLIFKVRAFWIKFLRFWLN